MKKIQGNRTRRMMGRTLVYWDQELSNHNLAHTRKTCEFWESQNQGSAFTDALGT